MGAAASVSVTALDQFKRKTKGLFKVLRGTRDVHREEPAAALLNCYHLPNHQDLKFLAALEALVATLGDEYEEFMAAGAPKAILADR